MSVRPILFSPEMVRALRLGHKTETRRVVKPQPFLPYSRDEIRAGDNYEDRKGKMHLLGYPYGYKDDVLYVREAWGTNMVKGHEKDGVLFYRADHPEFDKVPGDFGRSWKPSIHMSRWMSRLTLVIESSWVERLQDMGKADAIAEGIDTNSFKGDYVKIFSIVWDNINPEYKWETNPLVWVVRFRVVHLNVDKFTRATNAESKYT